MEGNGNQQSGEHLIHCTSRLYTYCIFLCQDHTHVHVLYIHEYCVLKLTDTSKRGRRNRGATGARAPLNFPAGSIKLTKLVELNSGCTNHNAFKCEFRFAEFGKLQYFTDC